MRTIEMYQDPETGIYESDIELIKRYRQRIIIVRSSPLEELAYLGNIIYCLRMPRQTPQIFENNPSYSRPYKNNSKYKQPEKTRQMSKEIKHIVRRDNRREKI